MEKSIDGRNQSDCWCHRWSTNTIVKCMKNERANTNLKKWFTICEWVDVETGELLTKSQFERFYYKINYEKKFEITGNYGIRKHLYYCRRKCEQLRLI